MAAAGAVILIGLGAALSEVATQHGSQSQPPTTTVTSVVAPNVLGQREDAAAQELAALGLRVTVTTGPIGAGPSPGTVVTQSPVAGTPLGRGGSVTLEIAG